MNWISQSLWILNSFRLYQFRVNIIPQVYALLAFKKMKNYFVYYLAGLGKVGPKFSVRFSPSADIDIY